MTMSRTRALVIVLTALILLASACSSSDDDTEVTNGDQATSDDSSTDTDAGDTDSGESDSGDTATDPTSDDAPATTDTSDEPVELTASFRGVSEDSIKVAFVDVDFARLRSEFNIDVSSPDTGVIMQALVDDLNERGGINGRTIDLIIEPFLPVQATSAEEVCAKVVEDEEVFAVLGGFGGPGAEDTNTCITGRGETMLVGGVQTTERLDDSVAPWLTPNMNASRRGQAFVNALAASGELDDLGTIAVHAALNNQDPTADVIRDALVEAGATVALRTTGVSSGDQFATANETEVMMEQARAEDVESIIVVGVSPTITDAILDTNEFTVVLPNTEDVSSLTHATFSDGNRMIGTGSIPDLDDPVLADCIEIATEAVGADALPDGAADDLSTWTATTRACQNLAMFEAIVLEAGPDLTNDSVQAALGTVTLPPLPVFPFASLGIDKPDARDTLSVLEWDNDLGFFVEIAGPFNVEE